MVSSRNCFHQRRDRPNAPYFRLSVELTVDDFDPQHNELRFRHRPGSGTRLKNGDDNTGSSGDGERNNVLEDTVADALQL